ncbi:hypothetical protein V8C26DRAFT_412785 [Trichoderma gracile]
MAESALHDSVRAAVEDFLSSENTSHEAKQVLLQYAKARPPRAPADPLIRMEEAELRLELIAKILQTLDASALSRQRNSDGRCRFTGLQLTFLLLLPVDSLRAFSQYSFLDIVHIFSLLLSYSPFMIQGTRLDEQDSAGTESSNTSPADKGRRRANSTKGIRPNAKERQDCIVRDGGVCILTGAAFPEVCHITPFALSATEMHFREVGIHLPVARCLTGSDISGQFLNMAGDAPGCTDKSWNMICLHPTLHFWWGKCLFALKCLGLGPLLDSGNRTVRIQFHWMPRNGNNPRDYIQADQETLQRLLQTVTREHDRGFITESRKDSSRRLETGDTFDLVTSAEDAAKMKIMIDIQRANTQLAAISGAAGLWDLPSDSLPDPEAGLQSGSAAEYVESWLENIQPSEEPR